MTPKNTTDFQAQEFDLRALFVHDAPFHDGTTKDQYIWFIAETGQDMWLALALSDTNDGDTALKIINTVADEEQHALITYLGETWEIIERLPVAHAQAQRDIIHALTVKMIGELVQMSDEQIIELRESDDALDEWLATH